MTPACVSSPNTLKLWDKARSVEKRPPRLREETHMPSEDDLIGIDLDGSPVYRSFNEATA
jgi:hypothetical protein